MRNADLGKNANDVRVFCGGAWMDVLGRGVRGEGKPSPRRRSRDEVHLKVSPDSQDLATILDPFPGIFDDLGQTDYLRFEHCDIGIVETFETSTFVC